MLVLKNVLGTNKGLISPSAFFFFLSADSVLGQVLSTSEKDSKSIQNVCVLKALHPWDKAPFLHSCSCSSLENGPSQGCLLFGC